MIKASEYGFAPGNAPEQNSCALQQAVHQGGDILVDGEGIAGVSEPVMLGNGVNLIFEEGLYLQRQKSRNQTGYVFVNEGGFSGNTNYDISLTGLKLICNDIQCTLSSAQTDRTVPGLRGVLSFYHVENLTIRDFETLDLPNKNFAIHICDFKNIMIEKVHIEGRKDGIHLGYGRGFVIRQGIFKTYDDPIALNAHDYATSNPGLGWIEDGLIEDCCDLNDVDTTGYFCRILAGSWVDWFPGMKVQHSDTVHYHNRLYRVFMQPDGTEYISIAPPVHEKGTCRYDGIDWVMVRESNMHNCGCRDIIFKNIVLAKNRPVAFSFHFDNDRHSRSVYPGSDKPVQTNIVFDHITLKAQVPVFLSSVTPMEGIVIKNTALRNTDIKFGDIDRSGISFEN